MEDEDIIGLFFARSEEAIAETDKKYRLPLIRLSKAITGNAEDAEECVNDTYLAAWNHIPPEKPRHYFAWLSKITRNFSCKVLERKGAQKRVGTAVELTKELEECLPGCQTVEECSDMRYLGELLNRFLESLAPEERNIFMKRYYWSMPLSELALESGLSEGKLASMLFRIRKKLRKLLEKEGYYEGN